MHPVWPEAGINMNEQKGGSEIPNRTLITHIHNAISFHVVSVCVVGPECSIWTAGKLDPRLGLGLMLLYFVFSALLHPLRSALEASQLFSAFLFWFQYYSAFTVDQVLNLGCVQTSSERDFSARQKDLVSPLFCPLQKQIRFLNKHCFKLEGLLGADPPYTQNTQAV